jgi:hypothetical protein
MILRRGSVTGQVPVIARMRSWSTAGDRETKAAKCLTSLEQDALSFCGGYWAAGDVLPIYEIWLLSMVQTTLLLFTEMET